MDASYRQSAPSLLQTFNNLDLSLDDIETILQCSTSSISNRSNETQGTSPVPKIDFSSFGLSDKDVQEILGEEDNLSVQDVVSEQTEVLIEDAQRSPNYLRRSRIAFAVAGLVFACMVIAVCMLVFLYEKGSDLSPSPNRDVPALRQQTNQVVNPVTDNTTFSNFPEVDWAYWQEINPDIIGWITIPDTNIDYPIVQEHEDNKGYWLTHDIYGNWNYTGTPYLDASCENRGLDSPSCPIAGHNMGFGDAMYAQLSLYTNEDFAKEHALIMLQTPEWKRQLAVQASTVVPGWDDTNRTEFLSYIDWYKWWTTKFDSANLKLAAAATKSQPIYTFYTCSYFIWADNERTLVYATKG